MTTPAIAPTPSPALSDSTSSVEAGNILGTEVFDAEVAARVAVMRAELARAEESMRTSVKIDLAKVCALTCLCVAVSLSFHHCVCLSLQLPREIREMNASLFFDKYHGDIIQALRALQTGAGALTLWWHSGHCAVLLFFLFNT